MFRGKRAFVAFFTTVVFCVISLAAFQPESRSAVRDAVSSVEPFEISHVVASGLSGMNHLPDAISLPAPTQLLTPSEARSYPELQGLRIDPSDPFKLQFILDAHGSSAVSEQEAAFLVNCFLAALTIPEKDLWVNLSPYEKDKIIPDSVSATDFGKGLLEQDYLLKQLVASFLHPDSASGKRYWGKVYDEVYAEAGRSDLAVNTFNKVWIVPGNAQVLENGNEVLITGSSLKVMTEEDYLSLKNNIKDIAREQNNVNPELIEKINARAVDVFQKTVLPEIESDVNSGERFARLRQMYRSLILAVWFKEKLKDTVYRYYIDQEKTAGIDVNDPAFKEQVFDLYSQSFKKGVYDYIRSDFDFRSGGALRRRYCSGGVEFLLSKAAGGPGVARAVSVDPGRIMPAAASAIVDVRLGTRGGGSKITPAGSSIAASAAEMRRQMEQGFLNIDTRIPGSLSSRIMGRIKLVDDAFKADPGFTQSLGNAKISASLIDEEARARMDADPAIASILQSIAGRLVSARPGAMNYKVFQSDELREKGIYTFLATTNQGTKELFVSGRAKYNDIFTGAVIKGAIISSETGFLLRYGGVGTYVELLALYLSEQGEVVVAGWDPDGKLLNGREVSYSEFAAAQEGGAVNPDLSTLRVYGQLKKGVKGYEIIRNASQVSRNIVRHLKQAHPDMQWVFSQVWYNGFAADEAHKEFPDAVMLAILHSIEPYKPDKGPVYETPAPAADGSAARVRSGRARGKRDADRMEAKHIQAADGVIGMSRGNSADVERAYGAGKVEVNTDHFHYIGKMMADDWFQDMAGRGYFTGTPGNWRVSPVFKNEYPSLYAQWKEQRYIIDAQDGEGEALAEEFPKALVQLGAAFSSDLFGEMSARGYIELMVEESTGRITKKFGEEDPAGLAELIAGGYVEQGRLNAGFKRENPRMLADLITRGYVDVEGARGRTTAAFERLLADYDAWYQKGLFPLLQEKGFVDEHDILTPAVDADPSGFDAAIASYEREHPRPHLELSPRFAPYEWDVILVNDYPRYSDVSSRTELIYHGIPDVPDASRAGAFTTYRSYLEKYKSRNNENSGKPQRLEEMLAEAENGGRRVLLYVGRVVYQKGLDIFIESLKNLDPSKYMVVVVATDADTDEMKLLMAKTIPEHPHILFIPEFIKDPVIIESIRAGADAVLIPSRREPFGYVLPEGLRRGKPIIVLPDSGGPAEVVIDFGAPGNSLDDANGVMAATQSPQDYAAAINRILDLSPDDLARLQRSSRRDYERRFNMEKGTSVNTYGLIERLVIRKALDIFEKTMGESSGDTARAIAVGSDEFNQKLGVYAPLLKSLLLLSGFDEVTVPARGSASSAVPEVPLKKGGIDFGGVDVATQGEGAVRFNFSPEIVEAFKAGSIAGLGIDTLVVREAE